MDLKDFLINSRIEIVENNICYTSIIQDKDDLSININIPYSGNKYYPLHPNMKVFFQRINKTCILKYSGIVSEVKNEGSLQLFKICDICFIEKVQRRNYYRYPIALPIEYCIIPKQLEALNISQISHVLEGDMVHSVTKDISGGGLCIILKKSCSINDKLLISLTVRNNHIHTICSIARLWKDNETALDVAGLKFIDISESTRDKIIKFIFEKLIANRKMFS